MRLGHRISLERVSKPVAFAIAFSTCVSSSGCATLHPENAPTRQDIKASDGAHLSYRYFGSGPIVIVVAGGPGLDAEYMRPVAEDIAADGYRAVLPDLRGTGYSRDAGKSLDFMSETGSVADLESLRQSLQADRVILVGHSFGGAMVQAYASAHPDRVARLILVDSTGTDLKPAPDEALAQAWMKRLSPQEKADYAAARARGDIEAAIRIKFHATITDPARADAFIAALKPQADPVASARISADYRANYHVTRYDPDFPVTIIYGENDWIRAWQSQMSVVYPKATIDLIPDAGHFSWIDQPALFASLIAAALK